jgi:hypothetical protein
MMFNGININVSVDVNVLQNLLISTPASSYSIHRSINLNWALFFGLNKIYIK